MSGHSASTPPGEHRSETELGRDLACLRGHWGTAYRITWDKAFHATHIASGERLSASTARALHDRVRAHYSGHACGSAGRDDATCPG